MFGSDKTNDKRNIVKDFINNFIKPVYVDDKISKKAYELYESRGGDSGSDFDDWLEAEKIVKAGK